MGFDGEGLGAVEQKWLRLSQRGCPEGQLAKPDRRPGAKLKPRWDVHLSGDDDQPGYAGESLSSVLGE